MNTLPEENLPPQAPQPTASSTGSPVPAGPSQPSEPLLFQNWEHPLPAVPERIPHLGHTALLGVFSLAGLVVATGVFFLALHAHLLGVYTREQAIADVHYTLGHEAILYLVTFAISFFAFPLFWGRGFFAGIQWNGQTAYQLRTRLFLIAILCFFIAIVSGSLMSSPQDAPIDKLIRTPGAPWFLFAFGVTFAPIFEEIFFRGFFLPALCTACDWINERIRHTPPPPPGPHGHPQWSLGAMVSGSIFTSLPFAALHLAQTGNSIGPFLLLVVVSLVLCIVRLSTRSLASSVLVHASYNFLLFSSMLIFSGGFRHLENM